MNEREKLTALKKCAVFEDFADAALSTIASYFEPIDGAGGDQLYTEGDAAGAMYVVVVGHCHMLLSDPANRPRRVAMVQPGDSFGELSLLLRGSRLLTVDAVDDVQLLELNIERFRTLKRQHPDVCLLLIMAILKRFGRVLDGSRDVLRGILIQTMMSQDPG